MGIGNGRIKRVTNIAEHMQYTDTNSNLEDTTTVQDALDSAGTQLSAIGAPVVTYIYSSNPEIIVTAVDTTTDVLTSVAHGLSDSDRVCFNRNADAASASNPIALFPGGLLQKLYYVVNKTDDTLQLSLTDGGAPVDLTINASMDLTKIHLEKVSVHTMQITGLTALRRYRALVYFNVSAQTSGGLFFRPSDFVNGAEWIGSSATTAPTYEAATLSSEGAAFGTIDALFDTNYGYNLSIYRGVVAKLTSAADIGSFAVDRKAMNVKYRATQTITDVIFGTTAAAGFVLNGSRIEVYTA